MTIRTELKAALVAKGYDAHLVNLDYFDIEQNHFTHYLSMREAQELSNSNRDHPVDLKEHSVVRGINRHYYF